MVGTVMLMELKYAIRALARQPVLSLVALATLTLGIGANTAIFSLVKGVLFDPLPYEDAAELVVLSERKPEGGTDLVSPPTFVDWRARTSTLQSMAAFRHVRYGFKAEDEPLDLPSALVTPELFDVVGASALLGRTFTPEEATPGADKVAVLSHGMWSRHFGSDRSVLGRQIELDAVLYTVVGVMDDGFTFPPGASVNLWTPLAFDPNDAHGRSRQARALNVIARLSPGINVGQARDELVAVAAALAEEYPDTNRGWSAVVESAREQMVRSSRPALLLVFAAVSFLLLIVCANLANLMLARLTTRRREIALRASLGAGRFLLIRQVLMESFVLSAAGALLGIGVAWAGVRVARNLPVANVPRLDAIGLDGGVLAYTAAVAIAVAFGFGLLPAVRASSPRLRDSLNENTRGGSVRARRVLGLVVAAEVALALVLLIGAGLTLRSFREMMRVDPGFRPDNVTATQIYLPRAKYPDSAGRLAFFREVIERLRQSPSIVSAGAASALPMHPVGIDFALPFSVEGENPPASGEEPRADIRAVTDQYFETMRIPLLRGRLIDERDREDSPHVVVINDTLARRYFGDDDPIGRIVDNPHGAAEVVGIVADVRHHGFDEAARPELYLAFSQNVFSGMALVVRSVQPAERVVSDVRSAIWAVDPDQAIYDMSTLDEAIRRWVFLPRLSASLLAAFAGAALLLAGLGIYGVIAYSVSQRTTEMGLRMALGADDRHLLRLVVRDSMTYVVVGIAVGIVASAFLTRFMSGQLFGVSRLDPLVFFGVTGLLAGIALLASAVPARRATRVDPLEALRAE